MFSSLRSQQSVSTVTAPFHAPHSGTRWLRLLSVLVSTSFSVFIPVLRLSNIPLSVYITVYLFIIYWWTPGSFPPFGCCEQFSNEHWPTRVYFECFQLLGYMPQNGMPRSYSSSMFNFLRTIERFSTVATPFYIPRDMVQGLLQGWEQGWKKIAFPKPPPSWPPVVFFRG